MADKQGRKGIFGKIMEHVAPEKTHGSDEFKEDVYHEHKGILGKVMEHITPPETHSDAPPHDAHPPRSS